MSAHVNVCVWACMDHHSAYMQIISADHPYLLVHAHEHDACEHDACEHDACEHDACEHDMMHVNMMHVNMI